MEFQDERESKADTGVKSWPIVDFAIRFVSVVCNYFSRSLNRARNPIVDSLEN